MAFIYDQSKTQQSKTQMLIYNLRNAYFNEISAITASVSSIPHVYIDSTVTMKFATQEKPYRLSKAFTRGSSATPECVINPSFSRLNIIPEHQKAISGYSTNLFRILSEIIENEEYSMLEQYQLQIVFEIRRLEGYLQRIISVQKQYDLTLDTWVTSFSTMAMSPPFAPTVLLPAELLNNEPREEAVVTPELLIDLDPPPIPPLSLVKTSYVDMAKNGVVV